ncbi:MAG: radical SAM protein [Pseudomonadota bacterium]
MPTRLLHPPEEDRLRMHAFHLVMIKPSHYDDDGYVIQWWRSGMPSNTLATLQGLATDCVERQVLGEDVEIKLTAMDETNIRVRVDKLTRMIKRDGGRGLIALVGVQSNQYPHALDLARKFREHGIQVAIGGFHVGGVLAMLPEPTPELQQALDLGISLFAGEAEEGRLDRVLQDAWRGELQPIYNYMAELPEMENAPTPFAPIETVTHTVGGQASFDAGRGCPFLCSFCTIINVQGRKSRYRNADDVERIIRDHLEQGIKRFFITDDNFARNRNWRAIYERLIELRKREGLKFNLALQVDTMCHTIKGFVEMSAQAGVKRVFIGLENINPDSLKGTLKKQNRIEEYRKNLLAWKKARVFTIAGYILGFPGDTPESILRDIEIIKRELPIELLEFFFLTPLPGSRDHKDLVERGVAMDPDLNKYDLNHVVTAHDTMSQQEWEDAYRKVWDLYYSDAHVETLMQRAIVNGISPGKVLGSVVWFYASIVVEGVHPLESGYVRRKYRRDRRPGLPVESPLVFYPRFIKEFFTKHWFMLRLLLKYHRMRKALDADPESRNYTDQALTPVSDDEQDAFELYGMEAGQPTAETHAKVS